MIQIFFFPFQCKTCSEPKQITSSSAIYNNPNLIKPIPVKPSGNRQQRIPQPSQVGFLRTLCPGYSWGWGWGYAVQGL